MCSDRTFIPGLYPMMCLGVMEILQPLSVRYETEKKIKNKAIDFFFQNGTSYGLVSRMEMSI